MARRGSSQPQEPAEKDSQHEAPFPQIECPPCALRGSELPVSSQQKQPQQPGPGQQQQQQQQPSEKIRKTIRANRASELRRQQHRQQQEQQQQPQPDLGSQHVRRSRGPSAVFLESHSDSDSDSNSSESDKRTRTLPGLNLQLGYRNSARVPRTSTVRSLLQSSEYLSKSRSFTPAEHLPTDGIRSSLAGADNTAAAATEASAAPEVDNVTGSGSSSGGGNVDLPRLREQLHETDRQRSKLKDRIADLAKLFPAAESRADDAPVAVAIATAAAKATDSTDSRYPSDPSVERDEEESCSIVSFAENADTVETVELPPLVEVERTLVPAEKVCVAVQTDEVQQEQQQATAKPDLVDKAIQFSAQELSEKRRASFEEQQQQQQQQQQQLQARREQQALLVRLESAAEECANLRLDREAGRRELEAARFDRRMAQAEAEERQTDLALARREVENREDRLQNMAASQVRTEKEVGNLRSQLSELRRQLDSAENSRQAELAQNQRYRTQIVSLEAQLESRVQELAAVTNALIEKRRSEEDLLARVQQLQCALASSEETVTRLTGQLATEQTRQRAQPPAPSQPQPQPPTPKQAPLPTVEEEAQTVDAAPWAAELDQRMAELDARINRLTAEARDGGGWRPPEQRQESISHAGLGIEQQQEFESSSQESSGQVATSTPQSREPDTLVTASRQEGTNIESLLLRTGRLETSNRQLAKDVQALRLMCAELIESRRELKNRLAVAKMTTGAAATADSAATPDRAEREHRHNQQHNLSDYLFETETLRAMIQRQLRDLQNSQHQLQFRSQNHQLVLPLSEELQSQQVAVDRSWRVLQASLNSGAPSNASAVARLGDSGAYRDFYLRRGGANAGATESSLRVESTRLVEAMRRHPLNGRREDGICQCRHTEDCPMVNGGGGGGGGGRGRSKAKKK